MPIYGPNDSGRTPGCTHVVQGGDIINIDNFTFQVISTPCHTSGHITFFSDSVDTPILFPGDTIFLGGCGRFFEGNGADMYNSLNRIKDHQIPGATKIFCGHEYSISNLAFALSVEPNNNELIRKLKWVIEQRDIDLPTIPSTWEEELSYNPFLRLSVPEIQESVGVLPSDTPENVMSKVRNAKDVYAFETAAVLEKVNSTDIPNVKSIDEDKDFIRDHEPNLEVASYERTTPIVCIMSAENYECDRYHSIISKLSNLGFFTREIVLSSKSTSTKISRKNGAKKSNLTKSCIATLEHQTADLTPPIVIAEGVFGFVAQKYLESYALTALCLLNSLPPDPSRVDGDYCNTDSKLDPFVQALVADASHPERQLKLEPEVLPIYSLHAYENNNHVDAIVQQFADIHNIDPHEAVRIFTAAADKNVKNSALTVEIEDSICDWLDEHF